MGSGIHVIDRETKREFEERVYGEEVIDFFYTKGSLLSSVFRSLVTKTPFSRLYGAFQKTASSRKKIFPFVEKFGVDLGDFEKSIKDFGSFNDFFTRKLKKGARPLSPESAILPADGRYLVYPDVSEINTFFVKNSRFDVPKLLKGVVKDYAPYKRGGLVIARLAPVDYHRYHFPCDAVPSPAYLVRGFLDSVNPKATKRRIHIFWKNKRRITLLKTEKFGQVIMVEVGATNVGSVQSTYIPSLDYAKGDEKGYFAFGGSCILLLFPQSSITFAADLVENTTKGLETYGKMGTALSFSK